MTEIPTSTTDDAADESSGFDPPSNPVEGDDTVAIDAPSESDDTDDQHTDDAPSDDTSSDGDKASAQAVRRRRITNPVVWREMYTRFDSLGTAAVIAVFVLLLGLPAVAIYSVTLGSRDAMLNLGENGVTLFEYTLLFMLGLVLLVAPLQASGTIAMERDRQTLMPMQISLLRPRQIALGKIQVATTFSLYLLLIAAPILAIAWGVGSVSVGNLVIGLILLMVTIVFATTVTVFFSSLTKRSIGAAFMALIVLGTIMLGPSVLFVIYHTVDAQRGDDPVRAPKVLLATNPAVALATAVGNPVEPVNEQMMMMDGPYADGQPLSPPLSSMYRSLIREQGGVVGFNGDPGIMMVEGTVPAFDEPVLFDAFGFPIFDEAGEPIPDDGTFSVDFDDDGKVIVLDQQGELVPFTTDTGEAELSGVPPELAGSATAAQSLSGIPLWLEYIVFAGVVSVLAAWGTTRRLRTPAKTER